MAEVASARVRVGVGTLGMHDRQSISAEVGECELKQRYEVWWETSGDEVQSKVWKLGK